jgi:hypothetical protein
LTIDKNSSILNRVDPDFRSVIGARRHAQKETVKVFPPFAKISGGTSPQGGGDWVSLRSELMVEAVRESQHFAH